MVRLVTDDDVGLKVLRDALADAAEPIDIVAVHGIGAHPDDSWCKNVGTKESPKWVNWLVEESMLPAVAPQARIMRYGYQSQWFGEGAMRQKASTVAQRLLLALGLEREALLDARHDEREWPGVFASTTGLIFFGTPFRGAEGMSQVEMLAAAQREYQQDEIQIDTLGILQPGNEFLQEVVDQFGKTRGPNRAQVACFYELKSSNVGRIVGKTDRTRFVVSESSGCLDLSDATIKRSLSRTHFDMNKFGKPTEEDFRIVSKVVKDMIKASLGLMLARSQYAGRHKVDFSLRGVPVVSRFIARATEMQQLEKLLLGTQRAANRRNVAVVHGLGGIGKTQLAVEFARKHKGSFSGIFWLDGSSEASVKQSFANTVLRLPRNDLTTECVAMLTSAAIDVDGAVRECLHWLSLPSNDRWLLIIDNVDRDHRDRSDSQAYDVKEYFPQADHGSVLITSRLPQLQTHGVGVKVGTVEPEQACEILESNAGKAVTDVAVVLDLLRGLPLALTQAGSYMRETNLSASAYAQHYNQTWARLMEKQDRFPREEYGDRSVLTTWTVSYEQVQRQSKAAASLLKLWGFLDSGELWYELIAAGMDVPAWLYEITKDKLEFDDAAGLLCRYSLVDGKEGTEGYSMHAVLHRWCGQLAEGKERHELCCLAAGLVAGNVLSERDVEYWKRRKRLLAHGISVSKWINENHGDSDKATKALLRPGQYYSLGYLLADEDRQGAVKLYKRALQGYKKACGEKHTLTLSTINNLGILYKDLGQYKEAEKMYKQALKGYEKTWGEEHTSTLDTINNLGNLYANLGQHKEAEKMYKQALKGYEKTWGEEHTSTLSTVNNLGLLYANLGQPKEAEEMYTRALKGYKKAVGDEHTLTLDTVNNLGLLYAKLGQHEEAKKMYKQALEGYKKAVGPERISTYVPALNTVWAHASLSDSIGHVDEARAWYSEALSGYEAVFGTEHLKCQPLREDLAALERTGTKNSASAQTGLAQGGEDMSIAGDAVISPSQIEKRSSSRRRRILGKLLRKRDVGC